MTELDRSRYFSFEWNLLVYRAFDENWSSHAELEYPEREQPVAKVHECPCVVALRGWRPYPTDQIKPCMIDIRSTCTLLYSRQDFEEGQHLSTTNAISTMVDIHLSQWLYTVATVGGSSVVGSIWEVNECGEERLKTSWPILKKKQSENESIMSCCETKNNDLYLVLVTLVFLWAKFFNIIDDVINWVLIWRSTCIT
jgi:hypothetical protein